MVLVIPLEQLPNDPVRSVTVAIWRSIDEVRMIMRRSVHTRGGIAEKGLERACLQQGSIVRPREGNVRIQESGRQIELVG